MLIHLFAETADVVMSKLALEILATSQQAHGLKSVGQGHRNRKCNMVQTENHEDIPTFSTWSRLVVIFPFLSFVSMALMLEALRTFTATEVTMIIIRVKVISIFLKDRITRGAK